MGDFAWAAVWISNGEINCWTETFLVTVSYTTLTFVYDCCGSLQP